VLEKEDGMDVIGCPLTARPLATPQIVLPVPSLGLSKSLLDFGNGECPRTIDVQTWRRSASIRQRTRRTYWPPAFEEAEKLLLQFLRSEHGQNPKRFELKHVFQIALRISTCAVHCGASFSTHSNLLSGNFGHLPNAASGGNGTCGT